MHVFLLIAALFAADPVTENQEALALAQERGERLYAYDRVAWVGTDDALPEIEERLSEGRGYIIHEADGGHVLTFFGELDGVPYALWRSTYRSGERTSGGIIERGSPEAAFSDAEYQLFTARNTAINAYFDAAEEAELFLCDDAQGPNVAILPPTEIDDHYQAYFMTPQQDTSAWPFGGHTRVTISREGETEGIRKFTNSCLTMEAPKKGGGLPVAMFVTHLLDPIPTEIHVFTAIAAQTEIIIGAQDRNLWLVDGETIELKQRN